MACWREPSSPASAVAQECWDLRKEQLTEGFLKTRCLPESLAVLFMFLNTVIHCLAMIRFYSHRHEKEAEHVLKTTTRSSN